MKKQILNAIYLVVALGTLLAVQSCKKENDNVYKIYATIQQYNGEKMHIEQGDYPYSCWDANDKVQMAQNVGTVGIDNNGYYIQFDNNFGYWGNNGQSNNQLYALYPTYFLPTNAQINFHLNSAFNIHLEPTQLYEETSGGYQKLLAPMVAVLPSGDYNVNDPYNEDHPAPTMQFKNLCAMLEVTVNGSGIVVTRIEVENTGIGNGSRHTGRPLWGDYEITLDNNNSPILREEADVTQDLAANFITKEVTLECEHHGDQGGVAVNGSHKFYIFVPPVEYQNLHVTVYAKSNGVEKCTTLISNVHSTFQANTMYPLSVTYNAQTWTTIPRAHNLGPFTVNNAGKQVYFAFSNVHHDGTGYFLPPYQYDFIGYHDPNGDHDHIPYTEMLSLLIDDPSSTTENPVETPYVNLGITGYGANDGWMLLTNEEWNYLLRTRSDNSFGFAFAIVASVPGLLLFPDNYSTPDGLSITITNPNNVLAPFTSNIISIPDFYKLENAGCAFLPCVYYTSSQATSITDVGEYWEFNGSNDGRWCSMKTIASGNFGMIEDVADKDSFIRLAKVVPNTSK